MYGDVSVVVNAGNSLPVFNIRGLRIPTKFAGRQRYTSTATIFPPDASHSQAYVSLIVSDHMYILTSGYSQEQTRQDQGPRKPEEENQGRSQEKQETCKEESTMEI